MKKQTIKTALLTLAVLMSVTIMAQPGNGPRNGRTDNNSTYSPGGQNEQIVQMLQLSEDQQVKMKEIRLQHQKAVLPLQNQKRELKAKLQTLSTAEKTDMAAINKTIDEISSVENKLMKEKASHRQNIRNILTEEQRLRFDMHCQNKGQGRGQGYGKGNKAGNGTGPRSGNASCPYNK